MTRFSEFETYLTKNYEPSELPRAIKASFLFMKHYIFSEILVGWPQFISCETLSHNPYLMIFQVIAVNYSTDLWVHRLPFLLS